MAQIRHPYTGSYQAKPPTKLSRLRQPYSHVDRTDYIARFDDGKCENESIVGGKGFSLAVLTSVKDTDVSGATRFDFDLPDATRDAI